jgi:hypothetical protein
MDYAIEEIEPDVWRVDIAGTTRIVRYRRDLQSFAPWDICTADGRRLWGSPSLESAFRWIQARTGHPTEGILVEGLLEQTGSNKALTSTAAAVAAADESGDGAESAAPRRA